MWKVIDLDAQGKDGDGLVFTLTIGGEKFGVTDQEMAELIRARHGSAAKAGGKRVPQKRGAVPLDLQAPETEATTEVEAEAAAEASAH